jgi:glycerol uptake facilitator-like aquaporin
VQHATTGAILVVLILTFGPLSGAHFNPAVSLAFALRGELPWSIAAVYIAAQVVGGIVGVWAARRTLRAVSPGTRSA